VTLTTTVWGWFIIHMLEVAVINLHTKIEVSNSTRDEDSKGDTKSRK